MLTCVPLDTQGDLDEAEQSLRSQVTTLTEELARQKVLFLRSVLLLDLALIHLAPQSNNAEVEARYRREQQLMLSAWHELGMHRMRESVASAGASSGQPKAWLPQQRLKANGKGLVRRLMWERCRGAR